MILDINKEKDEFGQKRRDLAWLACQNAVAMETSNTFGGTWHIKR